jgi:cytoskeleton protein RodZ
MDVGAHLRASREAKGVSLDSLAHTTRVQPRILAAIERNDVSAVPPRPFGRGFVRAYAREIGLDPDQTARDYFAQFAPVVVDPPPAPPPPVSRPLTFPRRVPASAGVLVGIVLIVGIIGVAMRPRPASPPVVRDAVAPTTGAGTPAPVADSTPAPADTRAGAAASPLTVTIVASEPCWITASADGKRVLYRILQSGAAETLTAQRSVVIRAGNAGALRWRVNDRAEMPFGKAGEVRTVRVTADALDAR